MRGRKWASLRPGNRSLRVRCWHRRDRESMIRLCCLVSRRPAILERGEHTWLPHNSPLSLRCSLLPQPFVLRVSLASLWFHVRSFLLPRSFLSSCRIPGSRYVSISPASAHRLPFAFRIGFVFVPVRLFIFMSFVRTHSHLHFHSLI